MNAYTTHVKIGYFYLLKFAKKRTLSNAYAL